MRYEGISYFEFVDCDSRLGVHSESIKSNWPVLCDMAVHYFAAGFEAI